MPTRTAAEGSAEADHVFAEIVNVARWREPPRVPQSIVSSLGEVYETPCIPAPMTLKRLGRIRGGGKVHD
jgi:hypothetical protein